MLGSLTRSSGAGRNVKTTHPNEAAASVGFQFAPVTLVPHPVDERTVASLHAHPHLLKHAAGHSTAEISALVERGESAFETPLTITQDGIVVAGYALWQLARLQKRTTIRCIVRELSPEQALLQIIERSRGSRRINDYVRILLALELEPWFKERAKLNQRIGGRQKGSSQLAKVDRLDVRREIAIAASVSAGNVSKVKHILNSAVPELQDLLRLGKVSISRGSTWAKSSPTVQRSRLADDLGRRGIHKTISMLLSKHGPAHPKICDGLRDLQHGLKKLQHDDCLSSLLVSVARLLREVDLLLMAAEDISRAA